ncbi:MAG: transglutaminase domain-containing protein [Candidatus Zixiibacteriota bacterium]
MFRVRNVVWSLVLVVTVGSSTLATPGDTVKSFPTPGCCPQGMTYDGEHLWVVDRMSDFIYKIDPENGAPVDSIPAPGYVPRGLTWDGARLWCVDAEEKLIFAVNPVTRIVEKTIYCPVSRPNGLAWDGACLWVADDGDNQLHQISSEDGTTIKSFRAPTGSPNGLTFDGTYLWVSDRMKDRIYMVTPERGDVIIELHVPGPHCWGLAWDGTHLWCVDYQSDRIYKLTVDDGTTFARLEEKMEQVEFIHQVRNYGPDSVVTLDAYVAIPENRNSQEMLEPVRFEPEPTDILTDKWGQKVAHFQFSNLGPTEFTQVKMHAAARISQVQFYVFPEKVGTLADIPADIRKTYLVNDTKFDLDNPVIRKAVKAAIGDETNAYWIARRIYNYVLDHVQYELARGWNVAPTVLERGTGSCSEYSFVFIAMCRAAGIPARYVGSVVIRGDDASWDNVYHRWVEIYLPTYGWLPVDPSRGDSDWPASQANSFGFLNDSFLITTVGGGGSEYLAWSYNANEEFTSRGKCKVAVENFAEWAPLETPPGELSGGGESSTESRLCR